MKNLIQNISLLAILCSWVLAHGQNSISGTITYDNLQLALGARVTIINSDTTLFQEIRSDASGYFKFSNLSNGTYTIGVADPGRNFEDTTITLSSPVNNLIFSLEEETHSGEWNIIVNSPQALGGTDLGILLPDGKIFYCHDTEDPFLFDPSKNQVITIMGDDSTQGFIGGTKRKVYGPGTRKVKVFDPQQNNWQISPNLLDYRWYPSVVPLFDGKILVTGGGGLQNPVRVNSTEIYDPSTGSSVWADTTAIGNEVSPIVQLYTGKILMTHRPPQLFDPLNYQWELAGDFVQGNRMSNGDHSDHELILLPSDDGRVVAIGHISFVHNQLGNLVELYDPVSNNWSLGATFSPMRSRAKTVLLPNRKIIAIGGFKEEINDTSATNQWGQLFLTDEYNVANDTWRRLDRLHYAREYHAAAILVPDGRVIIAGGEGKPGNKPPFSVIEAFSPPYLFRGIRPSIDSLLGDFNRGGKTSAWVSYADSVTAVRLVSTSTVTHFMNSGNNRFVELSFTQSGAELTLQLPKDSLTLPDGYYMLFVMVDDIPSIAKMVKVEKSVTTSLNEMVSTKSFLEIYPNPASQFLHVKVQDGASEIETVKLFNYSGKIIKEASYRGDDILRLDVQDLPEGIYILNALGKERRSVSKVMIKR
jgi:hypothetical protein